MQVCTMLLANDVEDEPNNGNAGAQDVDARGDTCAQVGAQDGGAEHGAAHGSAVDVAQDVNAGEDAGAKSDEDGVAGNGSAKDASAMDPSHVQSNVDVAVIGLVGDCT